MGIKNQNVSERVSNIQLDTTGKGSSTDIWRYHPK
jgi:hypothetical protein